MLDRPTHLELLAKATENVPQGEEQVARQPAVLLAPDGREFDELREGPMTAAALILLVEDDALVRTVLEEMLEEAGFKALSVVNGHQALVELEEDATRFRAVLTDIRLGRSPDGWEVARRARELVPGMPVLYLSGNSAYKWAARGVPNSLMVDKPYVAAQIVSALRTLLVQAHSY